MQPGEEAALGIYKSYFDSGYDVHIMLCADHCHSFWRARLPVTSMCDEPMPKEL
jgi:hypothetical protein